MATAAQIAANRSNAAKSTGPRTTEGKARCRTNALKHGLTAEVCLLPGEDLIAYAALKVAVYEHVKPTTTWDQVQTDRLTSVLWRLRRIPRFEEAAWIWTDDRQTALEGAIEDQGVPTRREKLAIGRCLEVLLAHDVFCKLTRYEAHLVRQAETLMFQLRGLRNGAQKPNCG